MQVDTDTAGLPASAVLSSAWAAPSLQYTAAYLTWQLRFPGDGVAWPVAVAAMRGPRWVGFAGATPRRVIIGGSPRWIHLVSFVAVCPEARGQGLAGRLYDVLLSVLQSQATFGIVTFGQEGSLGLSTLESAYQRAGYSRVDLGLYQALGRSISPARSRVPPVQPPALPPVNRSALIANAPEQAGWAHYLADPRGAAWIPTGEFGGGVVAIQANRTSAKGVEPFLLLANVFGPEPSEQALSALVAFGQSIAEAGTRLVTVPNDRVVGLEPARLVGFRRLPGAYRGLFYCKEPMGLAGGFTDLEVV